MVQNIEPLTSMLDGSLDIKVPEGQVWVATSVFGRFHIFEAGEKIFGNLLVLADITVLQSGECELFAQEYVRDTGLKCEHPYYLLVCNESGRAVWIKQTGRRKKKPLSVRRQLSWIAFAQSHGYHQRVNADSSEPCFGGMLDILRTFELQVASDVDNDEKRDALEKIERARNELLNTLHAQQSISSSDRQKYLQQQADAYKQTALDQAEGYVSAYQELDTTDPTL